ncbi:MAG: Rne/Rng family ribonuclease [Desulfovibrio sp.]|nr:Rne/Rng family ribonuclease [Desulfovibrio sp.]
MTDNFSADAGTPLAAIPGDSSPPAIPQTTGEGANIGRERDASDERNIKQRGAPRRKRKKRTPAPNRNEESAQSGARRDDDEAEAGALRDMDGQRKRGRGRRRGRGRIAKIQPEIIICPPLEIARLLMSIPALPCGGAETTPESRAKKARSTLPAKQKQSSKKMLISVYPGEQVEVGVCEDGALLEYYLDMLHQKKLKGNIYKAVVHNIDVNLQAAFVDYGAGKNGFLQIDEVHPEYWQTPASQESDKKFPPIQKALKTGQEILVQVVKEPSGNKGAFLTTWLSLAGRFLVLTPGQEQIGVSRKVADPEERTRLKDLMQGIEPGAGMGVIVRTVGEGATKTTLKNDLQYLKRLWRDIRKKATEVSGPALLHQEPGLSERAVRDYLTEDVGEIWVDNEDEARNVRSMAALLFPRKKNLVKLYNDPSRSLWNHFNLENQIEQIYSREVSLPSGGRLVFDQTEALLAIDINSGRISGKSNFEAMAFKTNMEASQAIARHLRLRDIGGQVVIDFIEMRDRKHILEVEKTLRQAMKTDRARHDVARMSSFGLLELIRQRMGSSALSISMETCANCGGTGLRRNLEWQALQVLRDLRYKLQGAAGNRYIYDSNRELGLYLLNHKRDALKNLEEEFGKSLEIRVAP